MDFVWAGVSVLAAGFVLGPVARLDVSSGTGIVIRVAATVVMLVAG